MTNTLFMLGASFLIGGMRHHVQEFNRTARACRRACCFWRRSRCWFRRRSGGPMRRRASVFTQNLSVGLSILLIIAYGLGMCSR